MHGGNERRRRPCSTTVGARNNTGTASFRKQGKSRCCVSLNEICEKEAGGTNWGFQVAQPGFTERGGVQNVSLSSGIHASRHVAT
jgi:hypothetical protein